MAVEYNDPIAMNYLGVIYGNEENYILAEKYLKMAILEENIEAMYNLFRMYVMLDNYPNGKKYLEMAAERGHEDAIKTLEYLNSD